MQSARNPHCWSRPDIPLDRIHVFGIEIRGSETPLSIPTPIDAFASILEKCSTFQSEQLEGSSLSWSIHSPIVLPFNILDGVANEAGEEGANLFFALACDAIRARAAPHGLFPESLLNSADTDLLLFDRLPSHITFCCFYRWGQETVTGPNLQKYFIFNAAARKNQSVRPEEFLSDVSHAGGSRASFFGKVKVSEFYSALSSAGFLKGESTLVHKQLLSSETSTPTPYVGLGIGIITMEAWLHASLPGCDAVAYHEAIGHGSNMPHPSTKQEFCVMSVAQYQGVDLVGESDKSKKVVICDEIKSGMYLNDLSSTKDDVAPYSDRKKMIGTSQVAWFWTDKEEASDDKYIDGFSLSSFTALCRQDSIVSGSIVNKHCFICGALSKAEDVQISQMDEITEDSGVLLPQNSLVSVCVSDCESLNLARGIEMSVTDSAYADQAISSASNECFLKLINAAQREKDGSAKREREIAAALNAASSEMIKSGGKMKVSNESLVATAGSLWCETIFTRAAGTLTKLEAYSFREVHFGDESGVQTTLDRFCGKCLSKKQPSQSEGFRDATLDLVSPLSLSSESTLSKSANAFIYLHDSSRGLSIALPLCGENALISSSGLKGPWHPFHRGHWSK